MVRTHRVSASAATTTAPRSIAPTVSDIDAVADAIVADVGAAAALTVVTGENGVGKTTLCRTLAHRLPSRSLGCVMLTPPETSDALMCQLTDDLGVIDLTGACRSLVSDTAGGCEAADDREAMLLAFLSRLVHVRSRAVVVIDNAHDLPSEVLTRVLGVCAHAASAPLALQLVLVGAPSLNRLLELNEVRPWFDAFEVRRHSLTALAEDDVRRFIEHRLWIACGGIARLPDALQAPRLTGAAVETVARACCGNRKLLNAFCDRVVERAEGGPARRITRARAEQVIADLGLEIRRPPFRRPSLVLAAALVVAVAGGVLLRASLVNRSLARSVWTGEVRGSEGRSEATSTPRAALPPVSEQPRRDGKAAEFEAGDLQAAESGERRAAEANGAVSRSGVSTDAVSSGAASSAGRVPPMETFRQDALGRAARFAGLPDVRALLKLRDEIGKWDEQTNHAHQAEVSDLLSTVDRLTNEARERQLTNDSRLFHDTPGDPGR